MKTYRSISIILALLLLLSKGFIFKQGSELKKVETALYDVAISNAIIDYKTYSLAETLDEIIQTKLLPIDNDGSNILEENFQSVTLTYQELYRYYVVMDAGKNQITNNLQEMLQDFRSFFQYLVLTYQHEAHEQNNWKDLYAISLKDDAYEGSEIIATMIRDLENIRSEVYENKPDNDKDAWKALVIKSEEYVLTEKVQQDLERIRQIIKVWDQ